jgi:hypothetical protein
MVTFANWLASEDLLAKSLDAPRIKKTNSGHNNTSRNGSSTPSAR